MDNNLCLGFKFLFLLNIFFNNQFACTPGHRSPWILQFIAQLCCHLTSVSLVFLHYTMISWFPMYIKGIAGCKDLSPGPWFESRDQVGCFTGTIFFIVIHATLSLPHKWFSYLLVNMQRIFNIFCHFFGVLWTIISTLISRSVVQNSSLNSRISDEIFNLDSVYSC